MIVSMPYISVTSYERAEFSRGVAAGFEPDGEYLEHVLALHDIRAGAESVLLAAALCGLVSR
jgi:hypothetical protein